MRVNEAIDIIANSDPDDFKRALEVLKNSEFQRQSEEDELAALQALFRDDMLNAVDAFCEERSLHLLTDSDLPPFFQACDYIAEIVFTRTLNQGEAQ
jgi:hypothetical protein